MHNKSKPKLLRYLDLQSPVVVVAASVRVAPKRLMQSGRRGGCDGLGAGLRRAFASVFYT